METDEIKRLLNDVRESLKSGFARDVDAVIDRRIEELEDRDPFKHDQQCLECAHTQRDGNFCGGCGSPNLCSHTPGRP